jgi:hypothetical protein
MPLLDPPKPEIAERRYCVKTNEPLAPRRRNTWSSSRPTDDQSSIGIILCKTKNKVVAEYALRELRKPVGVSEYRFTPRNYSKVCLQWKN